MATSGSQDAPIYVLRLETVRWAIERIRERKIHSFFPAYLHLRRRADPARPSRLITPEWKELGSFLEVSGGPGGQPYFRPFWHGQREHGEEWLNENIAGSYAPSSLRELPKKVIDIEGPRFSLRPGHAELARTHLLYGERAPLWPTAIFLYRDFGFEEDQGAVGRQELLDVFKQDWGYRVPQDDAEFDEIFDGTMTPSDGRWFQPFEEA